mmetsp:Transcript_24130/g.60233  ORF Transcript_24130/g.60233 Transcript_24130/m.60233 type:complete len:327 (+) Transcript_24130:81-1061(+)
MEFSSDGLAANATAQAHRRGFVTDQGWPFRLDIPQEYQDWIIVAVCVLLAALWCLPCICGKLGNSCSRAFTAWVYSRMHVFYWFVLYFTLFVIMFTIGVLPDWTVDEFVQYLGLFIVWTLVHVQKVIVSLAIIVGFMLMLKFRDRVVFLSGMEHITVFRFSLMQFLGIKVTKQRPVELFIWKVDGLQSSGGKMLKANDVFIECHMGFNEPMRTRVHNNAGHQCLIRESLQFNIDESSPATSLTLLVKDQGVVGSAELGRLMLSTRELCGIEDQTGKRRVHFDYREDSFVPLGLAPQGMVWLALSPVEEWEESDRAPLLQEDALLPC